MLTSHLYQQNAGENNCDLNNQDVVGVDTELKYPSHLFISYLQQPYFFERDASTAKFLTFSRHLHPRRWTASEQQTLLQMVQERSPNHAHIRLDQQYEQFTSASSNSSSGRNIANNSDSNSNTNTDTNTDTYTDANTTSCDSGGGDLHTAGALNSTESQTGNAFTCLNWSDIAARIGADVTPLDCFAQFHRSRISADRVAPWSKAEEKQLLSAAAAHEEHDWISIAAASGGRRAPIECLRHYQQALNAQLAVHTSDWSVEEDALLLAAIARHGAKNWTRIAEAVPGRTARQCALRRRNSTQLPLPLAAGRWLQDEERLLFAACLSCGAPQMRDTKKTEAQFQQLLSMYSSDDSAADADASVRAGAVRCPESTQIRGVVCSQSFAGWSTIAQLVPGK